MRNRIDEIIEKTMKQWKPPTPAEELEELRVAAETLALKITLLAGRVRRVEGKEKRHD